MAVASTFEVPMRVLHVSDGSPATEPRIVARGPFLAARRGERADASCCASRISTRRAAGRNSRPRSTKISPGSGSIGIPSCASPTASRTTPPRAPKSNKLKWILPLAGGGGRCPGRPRRSPGVRLRERAKPLAGEPVGEHGHEDVDGRAAEQVDGVADVALDRLHDPALGVGAIVLDIFDRLLAAPAERMDAGVDHQPGGAKGLGLGRIGEVHACASQIFRSRPAQKGSRSLRLYSLPFASRWKRVSK